MSADTRPIGVLDSGVGGISVLKKLAALMPNENFIYYGDSANAPYGTKSLADIRALTGNTVCLLRDLDCKCIVIACNTATSACASILRAQYSDMPIIGIEPALKPAALAHQGEHILVLATAVTLQEAKFQKLMANYQDLATIHTLACPGIVEFVEQGITSGPELAKYLQELLADYIDAPPAAVVLGCTHYPFVTDAISATLGNSCQLYDGAEGAARQTCNELARRGLAAPTDNVGTIRFLNSRKEDIELSEKLFNM